MTEAEIIRARIKELQRMLTALQAHLRTLERDKAISAFHRDINIIKRSLQ
jgi:hypothetical protein